MWWLQRLLFSQGMVIERQSEIKTENCNSEYVRKDASMLTTGCIG